MSSSVMQPPVGSQLLVGTDDELENEIDRTIREAQNTAQLIEELTERTLPARPWEDRAGGVNPLRGNLEAQFWFWNRAAWFKLENQAPIDALEIWSAMYLAFLSLQQQFQQRYHKGMALCNIGYALGRSPNQRADQAKSWVLGIIEDVLTNAATSSDQKNFRNLLSMRGVTISVLQQLAATIESRFVDQGIMPLFPETCVEIWLQPTRRSPSEGSMSAMRRLIDRLDQSYPRLPDKGNWWSTVHEAWGFLDWSKGVISV